MNARPLLFPLLLALGLALVPVLGAAPAKSATKKSSSNVQSDLATPEQRQVSVELANHLAQLGEIPPVPDDLKSPFSPPGFDKADPDEKRGLPTPAAGSAAAKPSTSRDILDTIAARIQPAGSFVIGGEPILMIKAEGGRQKKLKVGDKVTITFEGNDYELEITAIEATTFTLRLNNEKITRPIKPGKTK